MEGQAKNSHTVEEAVSVGIDQPGLYHLRSVVESAQEAVPKKKGLARDAVAGLTGAINNVPDGMASAALAGVNPLYGLYAGIMGPLVGGLFSSSTLMVVATTSAASLIAGQSLEVLPFEGRGATLFLLVILSGAFQVLFGLLRLGKLVRFVSFSVMTGLIAGVAVLLILSQLPTVTGIEVSGGSTVSQAWTVARQIHTAHPPTVVAAATTILLATILARTTLRLFGSLLAIGVPSIVLAVLATGGVKVVQDAGTFPSGVPVPMLPDLALLTPGVLSGALAVAVVTLVQGAGVSQSVPNPDGSRSRISRDFVAQGAANLVSGLFRGLPVGGSVGATALNVVAGAQQRWASVFAGLWMAAVVLVLPGLVSRVAMPTLGGLLIVAGVSSIKWTNVESVVKAGFTSYASGGVTFLAALLLPIQVAVGIGLLLSTLLVVYESSSDISVVQVIKHPDGRIEERRPGKTLASKNVTILDIYGPLFFSGARALERLLPATEGSQRPAVILRLRGQINHEATLIDVLASFASRLARVNGRLYLTGINQASFEMVASAEKLLQTRVVKPYEATPIVWESTRRASADARAWLASESGNAG